MVWASICVVSFVFVIISVPAAAVVDRYWIRFLWITLAVLCFGSAIFSGGSMIREYNEERDQLIEQLSQVEDLGVVDVKELQNNGVYIDLSGRVYMWGEGHLLVGDKK